MNEAEILGAAKTAGITPEQIEAARHLLSILSEHGKEGHENRIALLRALAELARENNRARNALEPMLSHIEGRMPEEVKTFRAVYMEGASRLSGREIGRRFCMDARTVHRHNRRVLEAMLPLAFGIDGIFSWAVSPEDSPGSSAEGRRSAGSVAGE